MKNTIIAILIILSLALGFFAHMYLTPKVIEAESLDSAYNRGFSDAKTRLLATGFISPEQLDPKGIMSVSGTIETISGQTLFVKINPLSPLADKALDIREIKVGAKTVINRTEIKSEEQYAGEMENFLGQGGVVTASGSDAPSLFATSQVEISALQTGDRVTVFSSEDITDKKQFEAITIQSRLE